MSSNLQGYTWLAVPCEKKWIFPLIMVQISLCFENCWFYQLRNSSIRFRSPKNIRNYTKHDVLKKKHDFFRFLIKVRKYFENGKAYRFGNSSIRCGRLKNIKNSCFLWNKKFRDYWSGIPGTWTTVAADDGQSHRLPDSMEKKRNSLGRNHCTRLWFIKSCKYLNKWFFVFSHIR